MSYDVIFHSEQAELKQKSWHEMYWNAAKREYKLIFLEFMLSKIVLVLRKRTNFCTTFRWKVRRFVITEAFAEAEPILSQELCT